MILNQKAHYLKVAKYYNELQKTALTDQDREFYRRKEEMFLGAVMRDERKAGTQKQREGKGENENQ